MKKSEKWELLLQIVASVQNAYFFPFPFFPPFPEAGTWA